MSNSASESVASSKPPLPDDARTAKRLVFVDLWHPRCGACRAAQERLEQLERQIGGKVAFESINVADVPEIAEQFDVEEVPALLVFHEGQLHSRLVGAETIQAFADRAEDALVA